MIPHALNGSGQSLGLGRGCESEPMLCPIIDIRNLNNITCPDCICNIEG